MADLHADGVADAAQELDVGAVQLTRALAAPQEVPAAVVPARSRAQDSLEEFLVDPSISVHPLAPRHRRGH